ncbi:hypothetical protein MA05_00190 [Comamonas aquatica]|nr:hypothetical protein MA05_00190 [Comamonas aquatica]
MVTLQAQSGAKFFKENWIVRLLLQGSGITLHSLFQRALRLKNLAHLCMRRSVVRLHAQNPL